MMVLISSTIVIALGPSRSSLFASATVNEDMGNQGESIPPQHLEGENCIAFDPAQVTIRNVEGIWKVVVGDIWMLDFADNQTNAQKALDIIRHYKLSYRCFVGGPDSPMQYYLINSSKGIVAAPIGPSLPGGGEECVPFNPQNTIVRQIGGTWKVVDGDHWIVDLGVSHDNANKALQIIKKYNFDHLCSVGGPGPNMMYFVTTSSALPADGELFVSEPVAPVSPRVELSNKYAANNLNANEPATPEDPVVEVGEEEDGLYAANPSLHVLTQKMRKAHLQSK
jgi:hypothetical protein